MRNPLKRYYFAYGESSFKRFDCTTSQWLWLNPQDAVTEVLKMWQETYGESVTIKQFERIA